MGVAAQAGQTLRAACTARSTSWWPESGTRERTVRSLGWETSMAGRTAEAPPGEPELTLWTAGYFMMWKLQTADGRRQGTAFSERNRTSGGDVEELDRTAGAHARQAASPPGRQ